MCAAGCDRPAPLCLFDRLDLGSHRLGHRGALGGVATQQVVPHQEPHDLGMGSTGVVEVTCVLGQPIGIQRHGRHRRVHDHVEDGVEQFVLAPVERVHEPALIPARLARRPMRAPARPNSASAASKSCCRFASGFLVDTFPTRPDAPPWSRAPPAGSAWARPAFWPPAVRGSSSPVATGPSWTRRSRSCAPRRIAETETIDLLFNNAGVMNLHTRRTTRDGFEPTVGTNHLGHFACNAAVWPTLRRSAGACGRSSILSAVLRAAMRLRSGAAE